MPQTPDPISAVSGPKFTILRGHVEDVLLLNSFFPINDICRKPRFHVKLKLFYRILGLHGTTTEMKYNYFSH